MQTRILVVVVILSGLFTGCADSAYWWQRTMMQIDCRPDKLTNGQCTSTSQAKGSGDVQAARP